MTLHRKKEDFSFRWQPYEGSQSFLLIQYLRQNWESPKKVMIEAIEAAWLPIACHQSQRFSSEQIKRIGQKSITFLYTQIQMICDELGLLNPYDIETQITNALSQFQGQILSSSTSETEETSHYDPELEDVF